MTGYYVGQEYYNNIEDWYVYNCMLFYDANHLKDPVYFENPQQSEISNIN
jgi:hypothetical protein